MGGRRQFVLDIIHPNLANVSKKDLATKLASMYKVHDSQCIQLFGFKTAFGGGRSTGFGLIYENLDKMKKFEPKYRLKRAGVTLRDSFGIPQVRNVTGNKILRILKTNGLAPTLPEDLYFLIKKAVAIRKHLDKNRKD